MCARRVPPSPRRGEAAARSASARRSRSRSRSRSRRRLRAVAAAIGLGLLLPAPAAATAPAAVPTRTQFLPPAPPSQAQVAPAPLAFAAPVDAFVTDGWRPPSSAYGPGNRGWQYGTADGDQVRAAGEGTVTFAGHVGGVQAVTVTHRGGLRTSYTRLATVTVGLHDRVDRGDILGTAMTELHFGVRLGDRYVDPGVLFEPGALQYGARLRPL